MKILTLNFLTCAVKTCKTSSASFPLHPKECELVKDDLEINAQLLVNLLPRLNWPALKTVCDELNIALPETAPTPEELEKDELMIQQLHEILMDTQISEGKLICAVCEHEYPVKEGVANFLLPNHLV